MANHLVLIGLLVAFLCEVTAGFFAPSSNRLHRPASLQDASSSRLWSTTKDDDDDGDDEEGPGGRRAILVRTASTASSLLIVATTASAYSRPANAGIDPAALRALPVEGDVTGSASRLRQIESVNGPRPEDSKDIAFETLPSGASYREYREGKGDAMITNGSKVGVEMTIRCRSFATPDEPGGIKYFDTKRDAEFNELAWTVGSGELPPELEECMMGMRKGAVRRIELPSTVVFAARKNNQLPLPSENNKDGKRRFENLFKTDATLLFEVLVTRIK
jgi:hypothetical protein